MPNGTWVNQPIRLWPERTLLSQCFVAMPIGKTGEAGYETHDDRIFSELIPAAVAASECGLRVVRADGIVRQDSITQIIVEQLCRSRLVIADVTWQNPNVWYEVGIRHAVCSPTILIAQHGTVLPFDSDDVQTEFYSWRGDVNEGAGRDFCGRMSARIRAALEAPPYAADSLMGRLVDHEMDYWAVLEKQASRYSPSAITLRAEHHAIQRLCERTLQCIFLSMQWFLADHDGRYGPGQSVSTAAEDYCSSRVRPDSYGENWLADLSAYSQLTTRQRRQFGCPLSVGPSGYRLNRHLVRIARLDVNEPNRVPLCFDGTLAQDADSTYAVSPRHPDGHLVLFCDGHVKPMSNAQLDSLKWTPA